VNLGAYETVREIHHKALSSVKLARRVSDPDVLVVIKSFQPFTPFADQEAARRDVQLFLDAASLQEAVAATGNRHWAPIHEYGEVESGAAYVTDPYEGSLDLLVRSRRCMDAVSVCGIAAGVVEGLLELHRACFRAHGNLKASNVLLAGKGRITPAGVFLSDPRGGQASGPGTEVEDLQALGSLICQMVLLTPPRGAGGTVLPSAEWRRLGKVGEPLRDLCNRLLDPALKPGDITLESIGTELAALLKTAVWRRVKLAVAWACAAAGIILIGGIIAYLVLRTTKGTKEKWNELAPEYNDWFESFAKNVDPDFRKRVNPSASKEDLNSVRDRQQAWQGDDFLKELAALVAEFNKKRLEPQALEGLHPPYYDKALLWDQLEQQQRELIQKAEISKGSVTKSLDIVKNQIGDRLTSWPALPALIVVAKAGDQWPWPARLPYAKELVSNVGRKENLAQTLEQIRIVADVVRRWPEVAAVREAVAKSPDIQNTPLARFSEFVREQTDPDPTKRPDADFRVLDGRLCEWTEGPQPVVRALADFVAKDWPRLHHACVQRFPPGEFPGNTSAHYWNWLQKVRSPDGPYLAFETPPDELGALKQRLENAQDALAAGDQEIARAGTDWPAPIGAAAVKRLADEAAKDRAGLKTQADRLGELAGARWCNKCWEPLGKPQVARLSNDLAEASRAASGLWVCPWQEKVKAVKEATRQEIVVPDEYREEAVRKQAQVQEDCDRLEQTLERLAAAPGNEESTREARRGLEAVRSGFVELQNMARRDPRVTWVNQWKGRIAELRKGIPEAVPAGGVAAELRRRTASLVERIDLFQHPAYEPGNTAQLNKIRGEKAGIESELEAVEKKADELEPRRWEEWSRRLAQLRKDAGGLAAGRGWPEPLRKRLEKERAAIDDAITRCERLRASLPQREVRWNDVPRKAEVQAECGQINKEFGDGESRAAACSGLVRAAESLAKDMEEVLGAASPAPGSEAIAAFWKSELDRLAKAAVEDLPPDAAKAADRGRQLKSHVGRLEQLLVHLANRRFSTDLEKKSTASWAQPLAEALGRKREAMLAQTVKGLPLPLDYASLPDRGDAAADQRLDAYLKGVSARPQADWKSFCDSAARLDSQVAAILDELENGDIDGKAVAKWAQAARDPAYLELQGVFAPVTDRIRTLEAISKADNVSELVKYTQSPRVNAWEAAWAAWWKLGKNPEWPKTSEQLTDERNIRDRLTSVGAPTDRLMKEGLRRWEGYFAGLKGEKVIIAAIEDEKLKEFDPTKVSLATTDVLELLKLSNHRARYLLLRWKWERVWDNPPDDDKELETKRDNFVALVRTHAGEVAQKEPVKSFMAELEKVTRDEKKGEGDVTKSGPGAAGWQLDQGDPTKETVVWRHPGDKNIALTFVRVTSPGSTGCYLCTTEVSVGLMQAIVNAPEVWPQVSELEPFKRIIGAKSWGTRDTWHGPRPWRIKEGGSGLDVNERWLKETTRPDQAYAPEFKDKDGKVDVDKVPNPAVGHPMNCVSPDMAVYVARLLGCRLPTAAEWKAAYQIDQAKPGWNCRDKSFLFQWTFRSLIKGNPAWIPDWPDEHIFFPDGIEVAKGLDAKVSPDAVDDGYLWFAKVDSDKDHVFHHLVGNVAEYVLEDPAKRQEAMAVGAQLQASETFLNDTKGAGLAVIGGSALSPPEVKVDEAYPCKLMKARDGYSDVGFRLAFTVPRPRFQDLLRKVMQEKGPTSW